MKSIYYKTNKIQQLRGFYYTAKFKNITLAAEFINLTQPSVTLQIKSLERDLNTKLFKRDCKKMLLTLEGEKLLKKVTKIIADIDDIYLNFAAEEKEEDEILNIAANHGSMNHILPKLIKNFTEKNPNSKIKIHYATKDKGLKMLSRNEVDIFITPKNFDLAIEFEFHLLKKCKTLLITNPKHPLTKKKNITLADLSNYNLIMPAEEVKVIPNLEEVFAYNNRNIKCSLEFKNWEITKYFVKSGVAISIEPDIVLENDNLFYYPMNKYFDDVIYGYVLSKKHHKTKILQEFIKVLNSVTVGNKKPQKV